MPKLTVLMPVYNGEKFLKNSIESVLNQSFSDYEFIIIDDKSKDNTPGIVSSYKDSRIRFTYNKENLGQMETLNVGIKMAQGEYVARMDQDDTSLGERFRKEVEILDELKEVGIVYSDSHIIDESGKRRQRTLFDFTKPPEKFELNTFLKRNFIAGNTVMIRRRAFDEIGLFNPIYRIAAEYDLFLRLVQKYGVYRIGEPLAEYRVHGKNSSKDMEKNVKEAIEILEKFGQGLKEKTTKIALNQAISRYKGALGMHYLFNRDRQLSKQNALEAVRISPLNLKAMALLLIGIHLPDPLIDRLASFRKDMLE